MIEIAEKNKYMEGYTKFKNQKTQYCKNVISPQHNLQIPCKRDFKIPAGFFHRNWPVGLPLPVWWHKLLWSCSPQPACELWTRQDSACSSQGEHRQAGGPRGKSWGLPVFTASWGQATVPATQGRHYTNQTPAILALRAREHSWRNDTLWKGRGHPRGDQWEKGSPNFCL